MKIEPTRRTLAELELSLHDVVEAAWCFNDLTVVGIGHSSDTVTLRAGDIDMVLSACNCGFTIVSRANEPTEDKPKTWGEMTDAEKGALLLAHHQGVQVEYMLFVTGEWRVSPAPMWNSCHAYRIRKEPVRETVELFIKNAAGCGWGETDIGLTGRDRIQFETLDGTPIHGTYTNEAGDVIVMEAIGDD